MGLFGLLLVPRPSLQPIGQPVYHTLRSRTLELLPQQVAGHHHPRRRTPLPQRPE